MAKREYIEEAIPERVTTISSIEIGHTTKSRQVILKIPGQGVVAFPLEAAEIVVARFAEEIAILKKIN